MPDSQTLIGFNPYFNYDSDSGRDINTLMIAEWDIDGHETHYSLPDITIQMYRSTVRVSPDGRYIGIIGYDTIMIVDWEQQRPIAEYYGIGDDLAWSPDSMRFATANATEIRIWLLPHGEES